MKLLRLKITDPKGFRSLPPGFEYQFRVDWNTPEEPVDSEVEPFVCAGRNGSGKSNLLEALASIFFQMEVLRIRRNFLPEAFDFVKESTPDGFELEYLMPLGIYSEKKILAPVRITKEPGSSPEIRWINSTGGVYQLAEEAEREFLLPAYIVGYSSGENEVLSLPFFKMRFVQFDEYWNCLKEQLPYPGRPDVRMIYLDHEFSQAILLCNLLFKTPEWDAAYVGGIGIDGVRSFRILLRQSIGAPMEKILEFGKNLPIWKEPSELIDSHPYLWRSAENFGGESRGVYALGLIGPIIDGLKNCATCWTIDENTNCLVMDYWVNDGTCQAFRSNFGSALELFQAFQVLQNLNLYSVSDEQKTDLYQSSSHYINETIPVLSSDERIMHFKDFYVSKKGVLQPLLLKELSDGEHQLLHSLGLCRLFRGTNSLFLLDEPETHFNPDWRSQFITRLRQCLATDSRETATFAHQEILITTHTPFLISDSKSEKVLVFKKDDDGLVTIENPNYNTLGASINKITMKTFEKTETVGGIANSMIQAFRKRFDEGEAPGALIEEIDQQLGDSVEKILLIKAILNRAEPQS